MAEILKYNRSQCRTWFSMWRLNIWLSFNRTKKALHATMHSHWLYEQYLKEFPHLLLKKAKMGVILQWPHCDL